LDRRLKNFGTSLVLEGNFHARNFCECKDVVSAENSSTR
jgi:hypothetical protein